MTTSVCERAYVVSLFSRNFERKNSLNIKREYPHDKRVKIFVVPDAFKVKRSSNRKVTTMAYLTSLRVRRPLGSGRVGLLMISVS